MMTVMTIITMVTSIANIDILSVSKATSSFIKRGHPFHSSSGEPKKTCVRTCSGFRMEGSGLCAHLSLSYFFEGLLFDTRRGLLRIQGPVQHVIIGAVLY